MTTHPQYISFYQITREVLEAGAAAVRPGITTDEIGK